MKLIKKIIAADHHRNGVCGVPFTVVLFEDAGSGETMVAICPDDDPVFENAYVLSVDRLKNGDISFGSNSWRGDNYGHEQKIQKGRFRPV